MKYIRPFLLLLALYCGLIAWYAWAPQWFAFLMGATLGAIGEQVLQGWESTIRDHDNTADGGKGA